MFGGSGRPSLSDTATDEGNFAVSDKIYYVNYYGLQRRDWASNWGSSLNGLWILHYYDPQLLARNLG